VRTLIAGSEIEKEVDQQMVDTYVVYDLVDELDRVTANYISRYPDDDRSCVYRAMRLTYLDQVSEGQAVMDSCLAAWRSKDYYAKNEKARFNIDFLDRKFDALVADVADDPATAVRAWRRVVDMGEGELVFRHRWFDFYRLAAALHGSGKPDAALAELEPILAMNPRVINALVLATKCYIDLGRADDARSTHEQLTWSVAHADPDFPARAEAEELAQRVSAMVGSP